MECATVGPSTSLRMTLSVFFMHRAATSKFRAFHDYAAMQRSRGMTHPCGQGIERPCRCRWDFLEKDACSELNAAVGEVAAASGDFSEVRTGDGSGGLAEVGEIEDVADFAAELELHALVNGKVSEE